MNPITLSGFNGIDFNQIIDAILRSERKPLEGIQQQEQSIRDKNSALSSLAGLISKLQTQADSLGNGSAFTNVAATSSDTTVATVSLGSGGIVGKYDLNITAIAKGQATSSTNGYTNTTDTAATGGSISFTINGTTTTAISITSATSLSQLQDLINNQNSGVVASIVNDGTNNKLVISSRQTGATNGFTINNSLTNTPGSVVTFAAGQSPTTGNSQNAQNAQFTVNGLSITSASNTVSGAVPGVSVTLVKAGTASVNVTPDYAALRETVKTFITQYNQFREFYDKQKSTDSVTGKLGLLSNDSVLRQAISDIQSTVLGANANGGKYTYLSEVGIQFTQTGQLKLDETQLNTALDSFAGDLQKLFQGVTGVNGVFKDLKSRLDNLDGTAGLIKTTRDSLDTSLKNIRDRIIAQELRLDLRRRELTKQFTEADLAMSRLNQLSGALQSFNLSTRLF